MVLPPETQEWYTDLEPAPTARSFRHSAMGVAAAVGALLVVVAVAGTVQQQGASASEQHLTALASSHAQRQLPQVRLCACADTVPA